MDISTQQKLNYFELLARKWEHKHKLLLNVSQQSIKNMIDIIRQEIEKHKNQKDKPFPLPIEMINNVIEILRANINK